MDKTAAAETEEDLAFRSSESIEPSGSEPACDVDLLRQEHDACLDSLVEITREEARLAARKVRTVAQVARAMAAPGLSLQEQAAHEMALVAEVACVLAIRETAAADLLVEAWELTSGLPLTLSALEA